MQSWALYSIATEKLSFGTVELDILERRDEELNGEIKVDMIENLEELTFTGLEPIKWGIIYYPLFLRLKSTFSSKN